MITDKIDLLRSYSAYNESFNVVADFLDKNPLDTLPMGRTDLEGGIFVNVSEYKPYAAGDKWEAHKKYADLQVVVCGDECMDGAALCDCVGAGEYFEDDDYMFYDKCTGSYATVKALAGTFAYFAPTDPHRPGIRYQSDKVKKAVFKIPV